MMHDAVLRPRFPGAPPSRMSPPRLAALVWDFDGTLADTRRRNLRVTRSIVQEVLDLSPDRFPALGSLEAYEETNRRCANWRELYRNVFGCSEEETDRAGRAWTAYQLADATPTPLFPGVAEAVEALAGVPQGIVSLNSRDNILAILRDAGLDHRFHTVVGYEEVDLRRQKPDPDALLHCLDRVMETDAGHVLYVGDHETDVRCARNANRVLAERGDRTSVVTTAACFVRGTDPSIWSVQPEHRATRPEEVVEIVRRHFRAG